MMTKRAAAIVLLAVATTAPRVEAQSCPDLRSYDDAREIIRDLTRIVAPSGLQESYTTRIGGIDQWLSVRGQDRDNPIVVFVHGGPATPVTPSAWQFQRPLEEYFTIVNWDQRGAGRTYRQADPEAIRDGLRISRYVDDTIEVVEHVRAKYGVDRVILMGHSWGSIVGMHAALRRPDLFHAYVGIGQVISTRENERVSFAYAVEQARAHGNTEALRQLDSIAPYPGDTPLSRERINIARQWAQHYGGLSAFRETSSYFFHAPRLSPEYGSEDVCALDQGSLLTVASVIDEYLAVDFSHVRSFPIPVVMFMGRHDYTTPSEPTARWLDGVEAPYKRPVWFERSAHMAPWEEPGKTLVSLLEEVRPLVDRDE